jgi:formamidopyrimidine-DNA glycosylase
MPELPEVETVMRGLRMRLESRTIRLAATRRLGMRWPFPADLAEKLRGRRILGFRRRGKYILARLDLAESLLLHLGMSGRIVVTPVGANDLPHETTPHEHFMLETEPNQDDAGWRLGFVDPRRFGGVDLLATAAEDTHRLLAGLGPEPLEPGFTNATLIAALAGKQTPIKAALLDQKIVAGLGNIYVSEALFRAGISPLRSTHTLRPAAIARLVRAIRETLTDAIAAGGSSLRDYVQPDGELGYFQHAWRVYGHTGQPCPQCPGLPACAGIKRIVQSGRSSFFCPRLQR